MIWWRPPTLSDVSKSWTTIPPSSFVTREPKQVDAEGKPLSAEAQSWLMDNRPDERPAAPARFGEDGTTVLRTFC